MAAEQKAVGSTAEEIPQRGDHSMVKEEASVTDHAVHSEKVLREEVSETIQKEEHSVTDRVVHSARAQREEASARALTDHADHSESVLREEHSVTIQKGGLSATDRAAHLERVRTDHVVHLEKARTDHADRSARVLVREEALAEESQADSATQVARASTRRTSTTSAMRRRAESIR